MPRDRITYSQAIGDEVAYTTCYMCACRCGIKVHLKDGSLRFIEGNRDHPVNRGVLWAKGSAGIMNVLSPARLRKPLKRVGPRGSGEFVDIKWDEALTIAAERLAHIRRARAADRFQPADRQRPAVRKKRRGLWRRDRGQLA